jgi:pre-mRNA-splicing factor ATP-dependent RNA helicase DHX15/PRP43
MATDVLLAMLKNTVSLRNDLNVVIMSATLDADKFSRYFGGETTTSMLNVVGRTFPVQIFYLGGSGTTPLFLLLAISTVQHIHEKLPSGDILLFLLAVEEIEQVCSILRRLTEGLEVLPLYSSLPPAQTKRVFARTSNRKCIVSTNIAETSLTIDGVVYVIGRIFKRPP